MRFSRPIVIPDAASNRALLLPVMHVHDALREMVQRGWGHLVTSLNHIVQHPNPDIRREIQSNLNEMVQALGLLYCFSVWDAYLDEITTDSVENDWLTQDEKKRLRAYRHVRHCVAHYYSGRRANRSKSCTAAFDSVMASAAPLQGVAFTATTIDLSHAVVAEPCHHFMEELSKKLIGRLANNCKP